MKKKIISLLILLVIITSITSVSFAVEGDINEIIGKVEEVNNGSGISNQSNGIIKGVNIIYTIIRAVGTGIALLMVFVLGIKYMMTSVEEKAEIKKQAVPILVGSAFIFATSQLLTLVAKFVEEE